MPGAHFDCASELPQLFSTLAMIHGHHLQLDWQAEPGLRLPWDREDLLELLGNLLDNACKWARSEVVVALEAQTGAWCLVVDDDGPGVEAARRDAVLARGVRLDETVPGSGLGLHIVQELAGVYGGTLALADSPLGGLRVRLTLPAAVAVI
mgnify:CR=1 FL=1